MCWKMIVACHILELQAATLLAAPVPKPKEFFPTTVGTKWVYTEPAREYSRVNLDEYIKRTGQVPADFNDREYTEEIISAEKKDGATILTIRTTRDKRAYESRLSVTEKGVFGIGTEKLPAKKPHRLLTLPLKSGDTWQGTWDPSWTMTVRETEAIKVPAGDFKAARIDAVQGEGPTANVTSNWYAPGVGMVQAMNKDGQVTRVLKSFTLGKEKE
jgi:hypothetical protein